MCFNLLFEPAHDKTYNETCANSEDSDQPAHSRSLFRVFADRMCLLQPPGYAKRNKQEPLPYWADVQADLSLCSSQRSNCRFCLDWLQSFLFYIYFSLSLLLFFIMILFNPTSSYLWLNKILSSQGTEVNKNSKSYTSVVSPQKKKKRKKEKERVWGQIRFCRAMAQLLLFRLYSKVDQTDLSV